MSSLVNQTTVNYKTFLRSPYLTFTRHDVIVNETIKKEYLTHLSERASK